MIEKTAAFKVGDSVFSTIEEAQFHELSTLLPVIAKEDWNVEKLASVILDNRDKIVDILTTTPTSKPKARKINGGTKRRKTTEPNPTPQG